MKRMSVAGLALLAMLGTEAVQAAPPDLSVWPLALIEGCKIAKCQVPLYAMTDVAKNPADDFWKEVHPETQAFFEGYARASGYKLTRTASTIMLTYRLSKPGRTEVFELYSYDKGPGALSIHQIRINGRALSREERAAYFEGAGDSQ